MFLTKLPPNSALKMKAAIFPETSAASRAQQGVVFQKGYNTELFLKLLNLACAFSFTAKQILYALM